MCKCTEDEHCASINKKMCDLQANKINYYQCKTCTVNLKNRLWEAFEGYNRRNTTKTKIDNQLDDAIKKSEPDVIAYLFFNIDRIKMGGVRLVFDVLNPLYKIGNIRNLLNAHFPYKKEENSGESDDAKAKRLKSNKELKEFRRWIIYGLGFGSKDGDFTNLEEFLENDRNMDFLTNTFMTNNNFVQQIIQGLHEKFARSRTMYTNISYGIDIKDSILQVYRTMVEIVEQEHQKFAKGIVVSNARRAKDDDTFFPMESESVHDNGLNMVNFMKSMLSYLEKALNDNDYIVRILQGLMIETKFNETLRMDVFRGKSENQPQPVEAVNIFDVKMVNDMHNREDGGSPGKDE